VLLAQPANAPAQMHSAINLDPLYSVLTVFLSLSFGSIWLGGCKHRVEERISLDCFERCAHSNSLWQLSQELHSDGAAGYPSGNMVAMMESVGQRLLRVHPLRA
jgi:hypothetical protein